MPYSVFVQQELSDLANTLANASNGNIYFRKSGNTLTASTAENSNILVNQGMQYAFINGDVVYLQYGSVTSSEGIPWDYPYTVLTAISSNLWSNKLSLWIDAKEAKSINSTNEKVMSKDYTFNRPLIENTTNYQFTYSSNTIDMTNESMLQSNSTISTNAYFKLALVVELPTQNVLDKVIFKHDDIVIKINQQTAADTSTQYMICAYDNNTFLKGVTFKPSDLTFKYMIYFDNTSDLKVSGNSAAGGTNGSFVGGSNSTIYINESATPGTGNAKMKLYEVLYYQSTANDIAATYANMWDYLSARWSLTTYTDAYNVIPYTDPYNEFLASGSLRLYIGTSGLWNAPNEWTTLNNASPNAFNLQGSAGTGAANSIGGATRVASTASGQWDGYSGLASGGTLPACTLCFAMRKTHTDGIDMIRIGPTYPRTFDISILAGGHARVTFNGQYKDFVFPTWATNTWYLITVVYTGAGNFNGSNLIYRVNGVTLTENGGSGGSFSGVGIDSSAYYIFGYATTYYTGLYINNTAMSQANYEKVEGYMMHSQGIQSSLNASHPYYSTSPY